MFYHFFWKTIGAQLRCSFFLVHVQLARSLALKWRLSMHLQSFCHVRLLSLDSLHVSDANLQRRKNVDAFAISTSQHPFSV